MTEEPDGLLGINHINNKDEKSRGFDFWAYSEIGNIGSVAFVVGFAYSDSPESITSTKKMAKSRGFDFWGMI